MNPIIKDSNVQRALRALLIDGFITQSFMGTAGDQLKYLFSWPPDVLEESQYANPWSVNNPDGSQMAIENISSLVDPIPMWSDNYFPSNNTVESVYRNLILPAQPVRSTKTAVSNGSADGMLSDEEFEKIKNQLPEMKPDDSERIKSVERAKEKIKSLTISGIVGTKQIEQIETENEDLVKRGKLKLYTSGGGTTLPVERVLLYANSLVARLEKSGVNNPMLTYCPSNILSLHFASPADVSSNWADTSFTCMSEDNEQVDISLKFTRADIERPWIVDYLFSMRGWTIPGQSPGWLSNGSSMNNTGLFPLLTLSFILCRDFSIRAKNQTLFQMNGLQILARCCKLMPAMPAG